MCPNSEHHFLDFFSPSLAGTGCSFIHKRESCTTAISSIFKGNLQDDGHIVPQYTLGWEICCHRSGVKGRFEQIAKQAEAKRQESEEMVARNMESDDEKKDSKTVVIPKEVKSPEPSQNKIEQEHTVALVATLTDQTMAESIGEENKESTKQVEKKEEPKVQDNEILCENNGREECIIDTRIQHFPPHDNAPTKSTSLNTASSTGHPGLNLCSGLFELGVFLLVHGPDDHTCENRKGGESKILGRSLRSEQGVTVNEKQTRKGMRGRTNIDALLILSQSSKEIQKNHNKLKVGCRIFCLLFT
ncbi:hypothetical protein BLNAU_12453 [Blattamonas nauphoetae]|uniref:Uncharacterized protein n=2 Tax=Blattamonas nauphoetae TaxID=2049346 RepID=A0ABQ9XMB2_9EUKA|nr:hypothetical protein BLNAU_12453 [Blattamonas nauphoetae]